jgi:hypothetical protein
MNDEMGGTCSRHGDMNGFAIGKQNRTDLLSHLSIDGKR